MVAEVIINRTAKRLNRTFDYEIPSELEKYIVIGSKVIVPFGKSGKEEIAYVVNIKEKSLYEVKPIIKLDEQLSEKQIELAKWMASRYFCNVSDCIKLMVTPGARNIEKKAKDKKVSVLFLNEEIENINRNIESGKLKSDKQIKIIDYIKQNPGSTVSEVEQVTGCSRSICNTLIKNGYLKVLDKKIERDPLKDKNIKESDFLTLNMEQKYAYDRVCESISDNTFQEYLLYGVTGSGKTEVYMQLIDRVIEEGKTAIMLVPEISLTPQTIDRFISRFGKDILAVIHSKLSIGEKYDEWNKIKEGKARIVIGARSALFAPISNLGIIIIDEEHDSSYKSESNPRYDAKQVAEFISKQYSCPLLLGSATPDLNSYYRATNVGNIELLELTKRANNASMPKITIIDLKQELANGNRSMLSRELYSSIEENIKNKKQTILFLNRRGYSTFIMCRNCGYTVKCKNCDIAMTYHSYEHKLKCHYCGAEQNLVKVCPECGSDKIRYFGTGTQKLEQEIIKQFPMASTIRMDVDTVTKKNSHEEILNKFRNDNIDILIGTQMVVKGHHFPNVTLVGVITADSSLNIDDYRASERTFQILTQVAGRAGRDKEQGKVIVQSYNPDNYSIQCARKQSYEDFYETEIAVREQLKYPPFSDIIVIGLTSVNEKEIIDLENKIYIYLKKKIGDRVIVLKPMPCPIDKIQNRYRHRIIIKGIMDDDLYFELNDMLKRIYTKDFNDTRISIDVNPNNMS